MMDSSSDLVRSDEDALGSSESFLLRCLGEVPLGGRPKRLLDSALAGLALVFVAPLMIVIAIIIAASDGGSPFFSHLRIGYGGRPFMCLKFRTMRLDAQRVLSDYIESDLHAAEEWKASRKLRNDPRITRVGAILRRTSLDELPQLINILLGHMSWVGPRPVTSEELSLYGAHLDDYIRSRPGLTGLWQVSGRSGTDFATRVSLDHQYVCAWSFLLDLSILARTPAVVLRGDGAY